MFFQTLKKAAFIGFITPMAILGATSLAFAAGDNKETIPVNVTLEGVQMSDGPLYISVQTRGQYQGIKGYGEVIQKVTPGQMSVTLDIDTPGEYAVSVWHDLNNDGIFSMTKDYKIEDGWGASGDVPTDSAPTFDDVRVTVGGGGANVVVDMIYPT